MRVKYSNWMGPQVTWLKSRVQEVFDDATAGGLTRNPTRNDSCSTYAKGMYAAVCNRTTKGHSGPHIAFRDNKVNDIDQIFLIWYDDTPVIDVDWSFDEPAE